MKHDRTHVFSKHRTITHLRFTGNWSGKRSLSQGIRDAYAPQLTDMPPNRPDDKEFPPKAKFSPTVRESLAWDILHHKRFEYPNVEVS